MRISPRINTNSIVFTLGIVGLIWIILYKLLFVHLNPLFYGAFELGQIFFGVFGSVVASSIFYFFVIYLEQRRTKKIIEPMLAWRLRTFYTSSFLLKDAFFGYKNLTIPERIPDHEKFTKICNGIILSQPAPKIKGAQFTQPNNWFELFQIFFDNDEALIKTLLLYFTYLPPKVIRLLDNIQYGYFQRGLDEYRILKTHDELSGISGPFWDYLKTIEELGYIGDELLKKSKGKKRLWH